MLLSMPLLHWYKHYACRLCFEMRGIYTVGTVRVNGIAACIGYSNL